MVPGSSLSDPAFLHVLSTTIYTEPGKNWSDVLSQKDTGRTANPCLSWKIFLVLTLKLSLSYLLLCGGSSNEDIVGMTVRALSILKFWFMVIIIELSEISTHLWPVNQDYPMLSIIPMISQILSQCWLPAVHTQNQQSTTVYTACTRCGRTLNRYWYWILSCYWYWYWVLKCSPLTG